MSNDSYGRVKADLQYTLWEQPRAYMWHFLGFLLSVFVLLTKYHTGIVQWYSVLKDDQKDSTPCPIPHGDYIIRLIRISSHGLLGHSRDICTYLCEMGAVTCVTWVQSPV